MYDHTQLQTPPGSLERAIAIALMAHAGQTDKADAPYILHPLRVMLAQTSDAARIVGVLHDVVEDGDGWTLDRLRAEGFSPEVVTAVDHLTKRESETDDYMAFVQRAAANAIARQVKLADINDNLDVTRLKDVTDKDRQRMNRYLAAREWLLAYAPGGGYTAGVVIGWHGLARR
jgi:(p)ppGpp synthase/HD superfamily hydrolase